MANLKTMVKRAGLLLDRVVPPPAGVTVLIYHRVGGGSDSDVDLEPEQFDRQLEYLAEHHRVVTLDDALAVLTGDSTASPWATPSRSDTGQESTNTPVGDEPRTVVITFDDGTEDFTEVVVPALADHGLPATLYAATRFIDQSVEFPWGAPPASWAGLSDAMSSGFVSIESHTHTHSLLDRLETDSIGADLDRSIDLIGEHLGRRPRHFAYPKALPGSPTAEIAVRQRFASAALATSRVNRPGKTDAHRLWRTPIQRSDGFEAFKLKAAGGLRLEGELRSLTARARYRGSNR